MPPKQVYPGDETIRSMIRDEIRTGIQTSQTTGASENDSSISTLIRDEIRKEIRHAFKTEIKQELKSIKRCVKSVQSKIESLSSFKEDVKKTVDFAHTRVNDVYEQAIPVINAHMSTIATALTQRILDLDVHRRKWSLNIQGIKGLAGEDEDMTRTKVVEFARNKLGITDAEPSDYAACHRLSQAADSGIIMRFIDLSRRNAWLDNAKNLKRHADCNNISISPDLPNDLRPLKSELLNHRKALPREQKKNASIRYLKQWPYVELRIKNHPTIRPKESVAHVCERVLGLGKDTLLLKVTEPEREDAPHIRDIAFPETESSAEEEGDVDTDGEA